MINNYVQKTIFSSTNDLLVQLYMPGLIDIYTMKVYLHASFQFLSTLVPYGCHFFESLSELPDDCDFVGFCNFDNQNVTSTIETLCTKSKVVFFDWNEFVWEKYADTEADLHSRYPGLQIFSTVVPNYASRLLFSGFWFMMQDNYYEIKNPRPWAAQLIDQIDHTRNKHKIFDCLLGHKRRHRDFIESQYLQLSAEQQALVYWSYYRDDLAKGSWQIDITGLEKSSDPVIMQSPGSTYVDRPAVSAVLPVDIYNQSWFSIVSTTTIHNAFSFFEEKIAKPMIAGRLFVCFSGQHYLKNLRKFGFRTFHGIIDESYDDETDPIKRWTLAWRQVLYLLECDPVEIHRQSFEVTQHNQWLFRNTDWLIQIKSKALPILLGQPSQNGPV